MKDFIEGAYDNREAPKDVIELLSNSSFRDAWDDWVSHRAEIKKKLTHTSVRYQLKKLARIGLARAVAAITFSIENGWQGIFEPREESAAQGGSRAREGPSIQERVANRLNGFHGGN